MNGIPQRLRRILATPRDIGIAYFVTLLAFAAFYYFMPDDSFYHTTIQNEPATVAHRKQFEKAIDEDLRLEKYDTTDEKFTVSSNQAGDFQYRTDSISFKVWYYYYNFNKDNRSTLEDKCGQSERPFPLYQRTLRITLTMSTPSSGSAQTVHGHPEQPINGCDREVLEFLYRSYETTDSGFQAMVAISPNTLSLLSSVTEEQLGNAPHMFWVDRATRMLYFSTAAITTTGFGDILPMTPFARLMAGLECLCGIVLAGAFINALTANR